MEIPHLFRIMSNPLKNNMPEKTVQTQIRRRRMRRLIRVHTVLAHQAVFVTLTCIERLDKILGTVWLDVKVSKYFWCYSTVQKGEFKKFAITGMDPELFNRGDQNFDLNKLPHLVVVLGQTCLSNQCRPRSDPAEGGVWSGSTHCPWSSHLRHIRRYREPSLQRKHLLPRIVPSKSICFCKESLICGMTYTKSLNLFLFFSWNVCFGHLLESPIHKYPQHMFLEVLNILIYFSIISEKL